MAGTPPRPTGAKLRILTVLWSIGPATVRDVCTVISWRRRAFDVARYLLFSGIPTNVGQVTSIRTIEKQIRRLKAVEYRELRGVGEEIAETCADQNLPRCAGGEPARVDLIGPTDTAADIVATLLYPVTDRPFRELYEMARGARPGAPTCWMWRSNPAPGATTCWPAFHGGLYAYDFVIDIGAYRDLHRHRRCHKFRQSYSGRLGFDTPALVEEAGATELYRGRWRRP